MVELRWVGEDNKITDFGANEVGAVAWYVVGFLTVRENVSKHLEKFLGTGNFRIAFTYIVVKVKNSPRFAKSGEDAIK